MDVAVSLAITFAFGVAGTLQSAMIGALSRLRGGREASIISPLGSQVVVAALLIWIAFDEGSTQLPVPFDSAAVFLVALPLLVLLLWSAVRGLPMWYATTGFSAGLGLVLAPRLVGDLGLALYFSAYTFGSCTGALAFDHIGALGAVKRRATVPRVGGLALVGVGVVLVRVA